MRRFLLSLMLFCTALGLMAQRTIRGTVSDPDGALPGANVVIKGTTTGTATDFDGNYEVSVPEGAVLQFSSVGLKTQEVKVTSKTPAVLNVNLAVDAKELDEVVVVGYGVQKKSDLTGSVAAVREEKLKETVATSIDQALQGRVSGVQVTASSGQPGAATSVRIRGTSSLTGSNEPLYVVDGMPIGSGMQSNGSNPLASINPADIVSMEVLKDASATAIYGSRAANGVVMITTRKGKEGESAKVTYDGNIMISTVSKKLDMMNLQEYAQYYTDPDVMSAFSVNSVDPFLANPEYLGEGTDWQDELFRTAIGHSHQLSVTGGSKETQYAFSLGYLNQEGIIINTDYERFSSRINLETQAKSWLKMGMNLAYTRSFQTKQAGFEQNDGNKASGLDNAAVVDNGVLIQSLIAKPSTSVKDVNGDFTDLGASSEATKNNPIREAELSPMKITNNNVLGNVFADIEPIKNLHWRTDFGIDYTNAVETQYTPLSATTDANKGVEIDRNNFYWRLSSTLSYYKKFNAKNSLTAMAGVEAWEASWKGKGLSQTDIEDYNASEYDYFFGSGKGDISTSYQGSMSMLSYLARLNYNYADRYLLTATGRFDGASVLSPDNRWGFFPSFSLAWRIDQEHFLAESEKFTNVVSNLKLRVGYGETGNAGNTMSHIATYRTDYSAWGITNVPNRWTNSDLKWETNWQVNAGVDAGFINNRISLTFDAFYKRNQDLIVTADPGYSLGKDEYLYTATPTINLGSMENKGFEISLNTLNITTKIADRNFDWTSDVAFTLVRNKVLDIGGMVMNGSTDFKSVTRTISRSEEGEAPGLFYGYKTDGLIQNTEQLNSVKRASGTDVGDINYVNVNGDEVINDGDMTFIGDPNPDFTFGFGNTLTYGPWALTIYLSGSYGNDVYNLLKSKLEGMDERNMNYLTSVLDFARVRTNADGTKYIENSNTDIPRPTNSAGLNANVVSDRYVEDGSYLRIQNIALSYTFPKSATQKMHIENLKLTANVQNVYTFTNYSGYNPEVSNSNVLLQGIDRGGYPAPRVFSFALNFSF